MKPMCSFCADTGTTYAPEILVAGEHTSDQGMAPEWCPCPIGQAKAKEEAA